MVFTMGIGEILREAREARNLTLDDIQEITKIQKRYLVAIEQNDFHALPGRFYARAFIKEYAQAIGLDPAEVLQGFDEEQIQTNEEETVQYTRLERSRRTREGRSSSLFSMLPSIIVIILVIGIIFVAWTLYQQTLSTSDTEIEDQQENDEIIRSVDDGNEPPEEEQDANDEDEESPDPSEEEDTGEETGSFSVVDGNSAVSELDFNHNSEHIEITFDVHEQVYIDIEGASGTTYLAATLDSNAESEAIDVSEEERVYFNIGNATGLTVYLNGVELEYPVDPNDRIHQKLWVNLNQSE